MFFHEGCNIDCKKNKKYLKKSMDHLLRKKSILTNFFANP